ncbi:MAG: putative toxin-antitoxin system toxin component, PIN family [Deltaproteobacteria bacterium]|nr:MAG: putative toxin-antitoxin system toxin component, PIN family [Deltaproteobacteria bacterium]
MKIFFDTNVWIAFFLTSGLCQNLVNQCLHSAHVFISEFVLQEFSEKMELKFKFDKSQVAKFTSFIKLSATCISSIPPASDQIPSCRDKDDVQVLWDAFNAESDYLVTGDKDLLVLKEFEHVMILDPRRFMEKITNESEKT